MKFFFLFWFFWFFGFFTVALLAWRVVFFCGHWVGVHYTTWGGKFALDWTTGTCYLFIDEMGGGMEGYGRASGRAVASGRFFAGKSRTDRNLPLLALVVLFFVFYEVGLVVLLYFTLPYFCRRYRYRYRYR